MSSNYYVTKQQLHIEFKKSLELGEPTPTLIQYFQKIGDGFASKFRNGNYCDKRACVNYAVSEAWQKWKTYNPERCDNIFSFYTTMIANDLRLHYKLITRGKEFEISIDSLFTGLQK